MGIAAERGIGRLAPAGPANPWGFTTPEEHDRTVDFLGALNREVTASSAR